MEQKNFSVSINSEDSTRSIYSEDLEKSNLSYISKDSYPSEDELYNPHTDSDFDSIISSDSSSDSDSSSSSDSFEVESNNTSVSRQLLMLCEL